MTYPKPIRFFPKSTSSIASSGAERSYPARHTAAAFELALSLVVGHSADREIPPSQEIEERPGPVLVYSRTADMREPATAALPGGGRPAPVDQTRPAMNRENREQRRDRRQMCSEVVDISFADLTGRRVADVAIIEDVNQNGICLSLGIPLPLTVAVKISNQQLEIEGLVRHCSPQDYGYSVGLEFAAGSEWNPELWQPKHLLEIPADVE